MESLKAQHANLVKIVYEKEDLIASMVGMRLTSKEKEMLPTYESQLVEAESTLKNFEKYILSIYPDFVFDYPSY
jgi:hypothetical protein